MVLHAPREVLSRAEDWVADGGPGKLGETTKWVVLSALLLIGFAAAMWIAAASRGGPQPNSAPPATTSAAGAEDRVVPPAPATQLPAPPAPGAAPDPAAPHGQPDTTGIADYNVIVGDTLAAIALRYGVPFEQLAVDNGITVVNRITPGRRLRVNPPPSGVVVIQLGATLSDYATSSGTTVAALMALNPHIADPDRIAAGGGLRVRAEAIR